MAPQIEVWVGGHVVARAATQVLRGSEGDTLHVHIECAAGHQPPWARRLLVHELLTRAERARLQHMLIVLPIGDSEILDALRHRTAEVFARPAGATCIVEVDVRPPELHT